MVLGFGEVKVDLKLNNFNYKPSDTIEGTVSVLLKKPKKAKGVFVQLFAEKSESGMGKKTTYMQHAFDLKEMLDGEKEYPAGASPLVYPFKIKIPSNILDSQKKPEGKVGTVLQAAQFLSGTMVQLKWFVEAKLDVPFALGTNKKVQINLTQ